MKVFLMATVFCLIGLSQASANSKTDYIEINDLPTIEDFAMNDYGPFYPEILQDDYFADIYELAELPAGLTARFAEISKMRKTAWEQYVLYSGEFTDTEAALDALNSPEKYWGSSEVLEINGVYSLYYKGVLVGYVVDVSDRADATMIQDGSGWVFYLDTEFNLVAEQDWQS